jgi:hypothetical protein
VSNGGDRLTPASLPTPRQCCPRPPRSACSSRRRRRRIDQRAAEPDGSVESAVDDARIGSRPSRIDSGAFPRMSRYRA